MRVTKLGILLASLAATTVAALAFDDENSRKNDPVFDATWVRVSELGIPDLLSPFVQLGSDQLDRGNLQVRRQGEVRVDLRGARPSSEYKLMFCPFGQPFPGCTSLGSFMTDRDGDANERLDWTVPKRVAAGIFILTRAGTLPVVEFATGFELPESAIATGPAVDVSGRVGQVNRLTGFFRINGFPLNIFVDNNTKFSGIRNFAALDVGMQVEVDTITRTDGSLLATQVRAKRNDD